MQNRFITKLVCSLRCPVNNMADISFITVDYGGNPFWAAGDAT